MEKICYINRYVNQNYHKEYYLKNKDRILAYNKEWRQNNPTYKSLEKSRLAQKKYSQSLKGEMARRKYNQTSERKKAHREKDYREHHNNPKMKLNRSMHGGICCSLKGNKHSRHWESLVSYTLEDLIKHLEKQFKGGMTWENYGGWHLDHKVPKSVFNFSKPEHLDFRRCWSLSNLQPMWAKENISKSSKLSKPFQPSLAF